MSGMLVNRLPLRCRSCGHDWVQETKLPMSMKQFVDSLQQLRCPECHASMVAIHIEFGMTVLASPPNTASA
jgi:Zn finger protein HypA/HybF involved in hydrogenase expression